MPLILQHRRGNLADLPASAGDGELLISKDDGRLHRGTGTGIEAIKVALADVINLIDGNGKIQGNLLPQLAITDTFVVADIAARDALVVGEGDGEVATGDVVVVLANAEGVRDSYIWDGSQYVDLGDGSVTSVNGQSGAVVLDTDDVAEGTTNLYYTDGRVQAYLDANGYLKDGDNANRLGSGAEDEFNLLEADGAGGTRWADRIDLGIF